MPKLLLTKYSFTPLSIVLTVGLKDSYITNNDAPARSDDEDSDPGVMQKADASVLAGRKIRKGGRKKKQNTEAAQFSGFSFGGGGGAIPASTFGAEVAAPVFGAETAATAPSSIFGGSVDDTAAAAAPSSLFGGFGGSADSDAAPASIFGDAGASSAAPSDGSTPILFGVAAASPPASTEPEKPLQLGDTTAPPGFGLTPAAISPFGGG